MVTTRKNPAAKPAVSRAKKSEAAPEKMPADSVAPPATVGAKPPAKAVAKPSVEKPGKVKKPKLVRGTFTIPKTEYTVLDELKQRADKLGHPVKKSGLLRSGIKTLAAMPDKAFLSALDTVPAIKK